jgi:hypothetical protein
LGVKRTLIILTPHDLLLIGHEELRAMGYNARNDEVRDNVTRMRRDWEAQRNALATVRRFNATLSAKGYVWFWPKITAALPSKHHWSVIGCDSCGTVVDLDLRVKPRDPPRHPFVWRCGIYNVRAAMDMEGTASSGWRSARRFDCYGSKKVLFGLNHE